MPGKNSRKNTYEIEFSRTINGTCGKTIAHRRLTGRYVGAIFPGDVLVRHVNVLVPELDRTSDLDGRIVEQLHGLVELSLCDDPSAVEHVHAWSERNAALVLSSASGIVEVTWQSGVDAVRSFDVRTEKEVEKGRVEIN